MAAFWGIGAGEAGDGLILFGWLTAFLLSVTCRLRLLEHDWLEKPARIEAVVQVPMRKSRPVRLASPEAMR